MEHIDSHKISPSDDLKVTKQRWDSKFSELRQEADDMAARHRQRLNQVLERSSSQDAPSAPPAPKAQKKRPARPIPPPQRPRKPRRVYRQNFDRIALWSTVGPSTIAAVFAGVAMSGNNVPLTYALGFVCAWFVLTTGLAIGAVKLFSTRECVSLLKSSSPRLGAAAITCALVAVLTVELAHLSITAIANPSAQQVSTRVEPAATPVRAAQGAKLHARTQTATKLASAGSIHYPTTPNVIAPRTTVSTLSGTVEDKVVALLAPAVQEPLESPRFQVSKPQPPKGKDELLGQISAKGKFVARRSSSRWERSAGAQKTAAPAPRNLFDKFINPVINSAGAKTDVGRVNADVSDQEQLSR